MKKAYLFLLALPILIASFRSIQPPLSPEMAVADVLFDLGMEKPDHYVEGLTEEMIKRGEELVHLGRTTTPDGKKSRYISRFYKCTSCHNVVREDPDLTTVDQDARLKYAGEKQLPYLQGSTFWGIVNRETWYNDDYVRKYGDLVDKARNSLRESTQLCAEVCSQGRTLEEWEMQSILAYYWSLQMKLSDLGLSEGDWKVLNKGADETAKKELIQSKFLAKSPATFADPPTDKHKGYGMKGRPEMGQLIYQLGCQHCHRDHGESDVVLDDSKVTMRWLKRNITKHSELSIYEIVRHGTYAQKGHREYMPHYTEEKMSHQQMEDLRAYIEQEAE